MRLIYWVSWVIGFFEPPDRPGVCVQEKKSCRNLGTDENKQRQEGCPDSQITRFSLVDQDTEKGSSYFLVLYTRLEL